MRTFTIAAAALLVVLAGSGIAGASVLTLSVVVADSTLYMDGNMGPTSTTFSVYGAVSGNTWEATSGTPSPFTLYGGIKQFETQLRFTGTGQVHPTPDTDKAPAFALQTFNNNNFFTTAYIGGIIVDAAGNADPEGTGGLGLTEPGWGVSASMANSASTTAWRATTMGPSQKKFTWGNTDSPYGASGSDPAFNVPVLLFTGELNAVAPGTVTIDINPTSNTRVWALRSSAGDLRQLAPTTTNGTSFDLTIVPAVPLVDIDNADPVGEMEWSKELGWNNTLHTFAISATVSDADPGDTLTYLWEITKPGGPTHTLAADGASFDLAIAELADLFGADNLPGPYNGTPPPNPGDYYWTLKLTVNDGYEHSVSDSISVFVPEPATMSLLALGGLALLKRKRKS